jgi:predicted Rossmann-fold nucleotide-binding protein
MLHKIISGGQTGADQAALDVAIEKGIPHGGWIPKGRKTEKGRLPLCYRLKEINTIDYAQRTELNVMDSDATLLFSHGALEGGSTLTQTLAKKHHKPCLHMNLNEISENKVTGIISLWLQTWNVRILNVAGPRESEDPLIYDSVKKILRTLF